MGRDRSSISALFTFEGRGLGVDEGALRMMEVMQVIKEEGSRDMIFLRWGLVLPSVGMYRYIRSDTSLEGSSSNSSKLTRTTTKQQQ
jgi:hypothetical protein